MQLDTINCGVWIHINGENVFFLICVRLQQRDYIIERITRILKMLGSDILVTYVSKHQQQYLN